MQRVRDCRFPLAGTLLSVGIALTLATPCHAADSKAARFYEDALSRYEKKDVAGAILQLKSALQIDQGNLPVHVLLGKALLSSGKVAAAEVEFNESLRLGVNRAEVVVPLARSLVDQGRQQEVVTQPNFDPTGLAPDVQFQLLLVKAAAFGDLGNARSGLQAIKDARALQPASADSWLAEIPFRIRAGEFKEALDAADQAAAISPNSADVLYQRGSIFHVQGNLSAALDLYDKALAVDPDFADARVARAGIYLDLQKSSDAAKDVAELLQRTPLEPRGWYLSALVATREGKPQEAKASLLKITSLLDPVPLAYIRYRPQLLMLEGQALYGLGQREKARPYLEYFQQLQPGTPVSKLLASLYLAQGSYDQAIDALDRYVRKNRNDAQAMALLAAAQMAKGHDTLAAALMQEALRNNDAPALHAAYGLSLLGTGQAANGQAELEAAFAKDPGQIQAGYALAGLYLRQKQTAKALAVANAMAAHQPGNAGLHNLLGLAKAQNRDLAGARAEFQAAITLNPGLVEAKLNLARLELSAGKLDRGQAILDAVLATDQNNTEAMYEQATLAERRGQTEAALRWLQKGLDVGGPDLRPGLALVDLRLRLGQRAEALKVAQTVSDRAPDDLKTVVALARAQISNANDSDARQSLTKATRIANFDAPALVEIALLQVLAKDLGAASYSLDKALSSNPDFLPAQTLKAEVAWRQGDFPKAELLAQQIIKKLPRLAVGYSLMGDINLARNQPAPAIEAYRKAHQIQPSNDTMGRLFGVLIAREPKQALQLTAQWLQLHPNDLAARKLQAQAYARNNNLPAARAEYEQLHRLAPRDAAVLNDLANVLLGLNDPQAKTVADQALALAPDSFVTIDTAGWAAFRAGQTDRAIELLRDARLRDPQSPDIRYHLAAALVKMGRKDEARGELQTALKNSPRFESRDEAQSLLQTLQ
jgi:putative PEP-CTERM system TPR-repeat lipoprotein